MQRNLITPERVAVTTSLSLDDGVVSRAMAVAEELGCPFRRRSGDSLDEVRDETGRGVLMVMTATEVRLLADGEVFWFHPNMARTRIEALLRGEEDRLCRFMALHPGDRVLDATCGLGADAAVVSHVVGAGGRVCALEHSAILAAMVREGARIYDHRTPEIVAAMRRVEVVATEAWAYLSDQPDDAWDVVYFDPMFEETLERSQGLEVVRRLASHEPITRNTIDEAVRVARRSVVMKDRMPGRQLEQLGFDDVSRKGRICYGRISNSR